jgi:hypothetical protein
VVEKSAEIIRRQLHQLPPEAVIEERYQEEAFAGQDEMGLLGNVWDRCTP